MNLLVTYRCAFILFLLPTLAFTQTAGEPTFFHAVGRAFNETADAGGDAEMTFIKKSDSSYSILINWDNGLVGTAKLCGTLSKSTLYADELWFEGEFDCSNQGSWPDNVRSGFNAYLIWKKNEHSISGTYRISGAGILPKQKGELTFDKLEAVSNPQFAHSFCPDL